jgi:hypothetical protein
MRQNLEKGSSHSEGLMILAVLAVIIFMFVLPDNGAYLHSPEQDGQVTESTIRSGGSRGQTASGPSLAVNPNSSYSKLINLGKGNSSYADQSYEEYVTISNRGSAPIDITGWRLANAKSERPYDYGGMLRYFPSDSAAIPQAVPYISPSGSSLAQNVVLAKGETAVVTTGSVGASTPYRIGSFKENICSGYLENMPEYSFTPSLARNCPSPTEEPGYDALPRSCKDFIRSLSSCEIPELTAKDREGEPCSTCANGVRLSSTCSEFVEKHYTYQGCLAYHGSDPDFSGKTWRIFLGRGWEMWAGDDETVSLYDRLGNLVDSISY